MVHLPRLTVSEAEILIALEAHPSLEALSRHLHRDLTVISKALKKISEKGELLTKVSGRWSLTETGRRMNQLSRDYLSAQSLLLAQKEPLRIGTNREFAALVMPKHFQALSELFADAAISIKTFESGVEEALRSGQIDLGFDCGRPLSPEIQFKLLANERIVAVATKTFLRKHKATGWKLGPRIHCDRLPAAPDADRARVACSTNDLATARSLCLEGWGWTLLPLYTVADEIKSGRLVELERNALPPEKYGVWKLRSRAGLTPIFAKACSWLATVTLE